MQELTLIYSTVCPFCKAVDTYIQELYEENPEYKNISIIKIEESEQPELAQKYQFDYVPCFYAGSKKVAEGVLKLHDIRNIFDSVLKNEL